MTNPTCHTCRWWGGANAAGDCKRRSPETTADRVLNGARWPSTWASDWCGEHQPREVAVEKPKERDELIHQGIYDVIFLHLGIAGNCAWSERIQRFILLNDGKLIPRHEATCWRRIERDVSA